MWMWSKDTSVSVVGGGASRVGVGWVVFCMYLYTKHTQTDLPPSMTDPDADDQCPSTHLEVTQTK